MQNIVRANLLWKSWNCKFFSSKLVRAEGKWTLEEEEKLLEAIEKFGKPGIPSHATFDSHLVQKRRKKAAERITWQTIADYVGTGRTKLQVALKYCRSMHPSQKKGTFSAEEDEKLMASVAKYGRAWVLISQDFEGRTPRQLEQRYHRKVEKHVPLGVKFREARLAALKEKDDDDGIEALWFDMNLVRKVSAEKSLKTLGEDLSIPITAAVLLYGLNWSRVVRYINKDFSAMRARSAFLSTMNRDKELLRELDSIWKGKLRTQRRHEVGLLQEGVVKESHESNEEFAKDVFNPENMQYVDSNYNFREPAIKSKIIAALKTTLRQKAEKLCSAECDLATVHLIYDSINSKKLIIPENYGKRVTDYMDFFLPRLGRVFSDLTPGQIKYRLLRALSMFGTDNLSNLRAFIELHGPKYEHVFLLKSPENGTKTVLSGKQLEHRVSEYFQKLWAKSPEPPASIFSKEHDAHVIQFIGAEAGHSRDLVTLLGTDKVPPLCLTKEHISARYYQLSASFQAEKAIEKILKESEN